MYHVVGTTVRGFSESEKKVQFITPFYMIYVL